MRSAEPVLWPGGLPAQEPAPVMPFHGPTGVLALRRVGRNGAQTAQAKRYQRG